MSLVAVLHPRRLIARRSIGARPASDRAAARVFVLRRVGSLGVASRVDNLSRNKVQTARCARAVLGAIASEDPGPSEALAVGHGRAGLYGVRRYAADLVRRAKRRAALRACWVHGLLRDIGRRIRARAVGGRSPTLHARSSVRVRSCRCVDCRGRLRIVLRILVDREKRATSNRKERKRG